MAASGAQNPASERRTDEQRRRERDADDTGIADRRADGRFDPAPCPAAGPDPEARRIVIIDKLAAQKSAPIKDVGARLLLIPPYSPDLNPIKNVFAKLKASAEKGRSLVNRASSGTPSPEHPDLLTPRLR